MPELDAAQRAAVDAGPVDLFISAGAGAGKTSVLAARFVSAVLGESPYVPCDPCQLLTVTYTDKAAAEIAERIRRELAAAGRHDAARRVGEAWISTIHGMCARLLRQYALDADIDPRFRVLDQPTASALESEALDVATRELIDDSPAGVALFDELGFATVARAVRNISGSIRALGLASDAIAMVSSEEATRRLLDASRALREIVSAMDGLRECATVRNNAAAVRRIAEEIACTSGELSSRSGLRRDARIEGLNELVDEAHDRVDEAERCMAQLRVRPLEEAFLDLASRFERTYAGMKNDRSALDFEDLQVMTARLLESRPDIANEFRGRFAMVMIDEFQDANALQLRIAETLAAGNLCTVGDENQSIYAFRHADVEVFRDRARSIECHHPLHTNYRIDPRLLDGLGAVFAHPAMLGPAFVARSWPDWSSAAVDEGRECPGDPFEVRFLDLSGITGEARKLTEAECIANRVAEIVDAGVVPSDVAVLMQRLSAGRALAVERALTARGIPAALNSGGAFFEAAEVVESRALLRTIDNVLDDAALVSVLAGRLGGLSPDALFSIRRQADLHAEAHGLGKRDAHLWPVLETIGPELDPDDAAALARIVAVVHEARTHRGARSLEDTLLGAVDALDLDLVCFASGTEGARTWNNVLKLARWGREYESSVGGGIAGFLTYLESREAYGSDEPEAVIGAQTSAVRIMSIHAAKGLEFRAVVVGGLSKALPPEGISIARVEGRPTLGVRLACGDKTVHTCGSAAVAEVSGRAAAAEIIRLLYVACTRAKESLTVVAVTSPEKEADDSAAGLFRTAVGMGGTGAIEQGTRDLGQGRVKIRLLAPTAGDDAPLAAGAVRLGTCREPDGTANRPEAVLPEVSCPPSAASRPKGRTPRRVSYSALNTYRECPYRYYLSVVARSASPPTARGAEALAFGSAVHAVLERCESEDADIGPLLVPAATAAGLDSSELPRLERAVRSFLGSDLAAGAFRMSSVSHEVPIAVPVAGTMLGGAIDLLARDADHALVIDFKTGASTLTDADARERFRLQGECYALAALTAGARSVKVVFAELERSRETVFEYAASDRAGVELAVAEIVGRISAQEYAPLERYDETLCESCPGFGGMCHITRT
ncbi:MAG: UvrD-helicase domain-containing protein [Coriobacteriia bacterium]|nr:UvrD-helicase domain-containing protein [Coriobacteriia bacterium]